MHPLPLAQTLDPKIWFYFILLLAMIFVGAIAIFALRRNLFSNEDLTSNQTGGGLMEHLDEMRRTGQITIEEYDQTRKSIISKAVEQMDQEAQDQSNDDPNPDPTT